MARNGGSLTVADQRGVDGQDSLAGIERLQFADCGVAFDGDGVGGQAYRIYQAAFNRTPDANGVGYWFAVMDMGAPLAAIAQGFVASNEFRAAYGSAPTNAELVARFYQNLLHRPAEKAGYDFWLNVLDSKAASVTDVLSDISESRENVDNPAAVSGAGFDYGLY